MTLSDDLERVDRYVEGMYERERRREIWLLVVLVSKPAVCRYQRACVWSSKENGAESNECTKIQLAGVVHRLEKEIRAIMNAEANPDTETAKAREVREKQMR